MTDAVLDSTRDLAASALGELRDVVAGLPAEALDWRPPGDETNSIAVLVTHSLHSARQWLAMAADLPRPDRDRDAEFDAHGVGPDALLGLIDSFTADCMAAIDAAAGVDWNATRQWKRLDGTTRDITAAYAAFHAVEHLRGHVDQASLVRHLWEARAS
jgi:hypothetical protein